MSDIVIRFVGAPVYEGKSGWPAKDLTQEELDARGLEKAKMLAYRPRLYEEVKPTRKRVKRESAKSGSSHRRADPQIQSGESADVHEGHDDDSGGASVGLHPSTGEPGED